jgi:hypothetical protein
VASPFSDNDVLPVQEEVKIINVKIALRPVPLEDWWRKRGYQRTRIKYVFYRAKNFHRDHDPVRKIDPDQSGFD